MKIIFTLSTREGAVAIIDSPCLAILKSTLDNMLSTCTLLNSADNPIRLCNCWNAELNYAEYKN